jgi:hypothetical protein
MPGTGHRNAVFRDPLEPRIAHPIVPGRVEVRVCRRVDLLAVRSDFLETPVTLPAISIAYEGRMCRRSERHAILPRTLIAGATSPLSIENFDSSLAWHTVRIRRTKSSDLAETTVAGPALLACAVMRMRRDIVIKPLTDATTRQRHRAGQEQTR